MAVQMMMPSSNRFFAILVGLLLLLTPVSYASQFSGADNAGTGTPGREDYESVNSPNSLLTGKAISQMVINVSEDGNVTILKTGTGIKEAKGAKEAGEAKKITAQDANNDCANAQFFDYKTQIASGSISPADDNDWWKINLDSGGQLTVQLDGPSNADFDLYVHKSCSTGWICRPYETDADEACVIAATSGYYYINIDGYSGTGSYLIQANLAGSQYDLVPSDFTVTPSNPSKQDSITVRYTATNTGPHDITSYFNYKLYIDDIHYGTCNANSGLGAGLTGYCDRTDITLSAGTHVLKNVVDQDNNIAETNEGNNVKTQNQYVTGNYDLVPGDFTVTPSNPSKQDQITVRYRAKNNGPDDVTGAFDHRLYIDNVAYQICTTSNGLVAGGIVYCDKTGITLSAGTHVLKNIVDLNNNIAETNEGNNVKTQDQYVTGNYDLLPAEFAVTPANPSQLDSITVRYRVTNTGPDDITGYFNFKLYIDDIHYGTCNANSGLGAGITGYCDRTGITLTQGTHVLKNVVDQDNNIAETNEGNNVLEQQLPVGCPPDKPYYYDNNCHKCPQDALECSGLCYNKQNSCSFGEPFCGSDGNAYCCAQNYPYACPAGNTCFQKPEYCDGRPIYQCEDKKWVCIDGSAVGTCVGNTLYCCPQNFPYYWTSDGMCHTSPHQEVNCPVPDGSSGQCDCDTNAECPPSHPFCEENYPGFNEGYDACLPSAPEYCGNGACAGNEDYNNCQQDCTAPQGVINVDAVNNNNNKPLSGAYVYLDDSFKGLTDGNGKKSFAAGYGQRSLKVKCPDNSPCGTKTVNVDGVEYASFACNCNVGVENINLRIILKAKPQDYERGHFASNVDLLIDDQYAGTTNQYGTIDAENLASGNHRLDVFLKTREDGIDRFYTGGTVIALDEEYEQMVFTLVKDESPDSPNSKISVYRDNEQVFKIEEYEVTPEVVWFAVAYIVVVVAGLAWDTYDYLTCIDANAQFRPPNKDSWHSYNCVNSQSMTPDQFNDCSEKVLSRDQNTVDNCGFEFTMLALNFVPVGNVFKFGGKIAVKVVKGTTKITATLPYINDAFGGAYKAATFVKNNEFYAEAIDTVNKGAKYTFKFVGNAFKLFDNIVGSIVNVIAKNPEAWVKISERVDNLLLNVKPGDIPAEKLGSIRTIKGVLGEKAKDEYIAVIKEALEKEGTEVIVEKGTPKALYKESANYVFKYSETGTGIKIFNKASGQLAGELDGLMFVNGKPIVIEAKAGLAENMVDGLEKNEFFSSKIGTIEDLTGQKPEALLLIPKGEADELSEVIDSLENHLKNKGTHLAYDEFPVDWGGFEDAARRIKNEVNP